MSLWTSIRDAVETVAVVAGNYYLPGSSMLTSKIVSRGSQEQLNSTLGQIAQLASGASGASAGNFANYGKILQGMPPTLAQGASSVEEAGKIAQVLRAADPALTLEQATQAGQAYANVGYSATQLTAATSLQTAVTNGTLTQVEANAISNAGATGAAGGGSPTLLASLSDKAKSFLGTQGGAQVLGALAGTLGGMGSAPAAGPNTTTTSQQFSPAEKANRDYQQAEALRLYNQQAGLAQTLSPVAGVAPQSADTLAAQNTLRGVSGGTATDMARQVADAQKYGLTTAMDVQNNPYIQGAMEAALRPVVQNFTETGGVLQNIRSDNLQAGQYGGTRQGLETGLAAGRLGQTLADTTSKMAMEAYAKGQDTFAKTLSLAPQNVRVQEAPSQMLSAIGTQNEAFNQEQLNAQAQANQAKLNAGTQQLQNFTNLTGATANPSTTVTGPPTPAPRSNLIGDAMSGAILANQIWGALKP